MGDFLQGCDVLGRGWVSVGVGGDSPHPQVFGQFSERKAGDGARQAVLFENINQGGNVYTFFIGDKNLWINVRDRVTLYW